MKHCKKIRTLFTDALYDELNEQDEHILLAHLDDCDDCTEEYNKLREVVRTIGRREEFDPGEEYWDGWWDRFDARLEQEMETPAAQVWWTSKALKTAWDSRIYRSVGVAAAMLIIGLSAGTWYGSKKQAPGMAQAPMKMEEAKVVSTIDRAERFMGRAEVVLLNIVNMDTAEAADVMPSYDINRRVSRELVDEAASLKDALDSEGYQKLAHLISELELILMQIANLEETYNIDAIEIIQSGAEYSGLLFKINIEELMSGKERTERTRQKGGNKKNI